MTFSNALSTPSSRETATVPESGEDLLLLDAEDEEVDLGDPSLRVTLPRSEPMALSLFSLSAVMSTNFLLGTPLGLILVCSFLGVELAVTLNGDAVGFGLLVT